MRIKRATYWLREPGSGVIAALEGVEAGRARRRSPRLTGDAHSRRCFDAVLPRGRNWQGRGICRGLGSSTGAITTDRLSSTPGN